MNVASSVPQIFDTVALDRIDLSDHTYRITTPGDLSGLARSIGAVGVLSPPIVKQRRSRWSVVCGFGRITACRLLGEASTSCRILSADTDVLTCAKIAIADNTARRRLNSVELSRAYRLLSQALSLEELPSAANQVGLPGGQELMEKVWGLCEASEQIQRGIVEEWIALPVALELIRMPEAEAAAVADLMGSVPLSLNRQREVLALIREIARREDLDLAAVVHGPELAGIAQDPDMDSPQKAKALLAALTRRRFPARIRFQERFEEKRRQLPLSEGMSLLPPANFEGNRYELRLSFHSSAHLEKLADGVRAIAQSKPLQGILSEE